MFAETTLDSITHSGRGRRRFLCKFSAVHCVCFILVHFGKNDGANLITGCLCCIMITTTPAATLAFLHMLGPTESCRCRRGQPVLDLTCCSYSLFRGMKPTKSAHFVRMHRAAQHIFCATHKRLPLSDAFPVRSSGCPTTAQRALCLCPLSTYHEDQLPFADIYRSPRLSFAPFSAPRSRWKGAPLP